MAIICKRCGGKDSDRRGLVIIYPDGNEHRACHYLDERSLWFYDHASWGYVPAIQTTEQGHMESARRYADAEVWAEENSLEFAWAYDEEYYNLLMCLAYKDGEVVASVGGVDSGDEDYRRVIEAELAIEAMDQS